MTTEQHYAIMFADIAGSTKLYDSLGNEEANKLINQCIERLTAITSQYHGTVIKTIGDEIMASFPNANDAIDAAVQMQNSISGDDSSALSIRVGLQYGPAISREGDLFGDAVNVAARMAGVAKAKQIVTTEWCIQKLSDDRKKNARLFDLARVKGKDEELSIYIIDWEEDGNATKFATAYSMKNISASKMLMVLKYAGKEQILTDHDMTTAITIGRESTCNITLNASYASRSHASLSVNRGKFVLTDHSSNGTYVRFKGQEDLFLRREALPLMGDGYISLGEAVDVHSPTIISFSILQTG
ncbi:MAG: adenylate cyclase [Pseudomonadota bacterium]|nr:adenylate cyclase [Pseudomonadota bacterium]